MRPVDQTAPQDAPGDGLPFFSVLNELTEFYGHLYDQSFGGFFRRPSLGSLGAFSEALLKSVDAWISAQGAGLPYQLLLLNIWVKALESFLQHLASSKEISVWDWRRLLQLWSRLFDQTFAQTFRSPEALQIQGTFLNRTLRWQRQQQQLVEVLLKANHLPTRSEMDALQRSLYELRRELKQLKQEKLPDGPQTTESGTASGQEPAHDPAAMDYRPVDAGRLHGTAGLPLPDRDH